MGSSGVTGNIYEVKHIKRYRELFESGTTLTPEQINWLDKCTQGTWELNSQTGLVDVDGNFNCTGQKLGGFKGVRFGKVTGDFSCNHNSLTSLEGAPQKVGGDFYCDRNSLVSLEGAPQKVGGGFSCNRNTVSVTTLKKIWNKMESGLSYNEALKRLALDIPKEDWDLLDKPGLDVDDKFVKGASVLRRFL